MNRRAAGYIAEERAARLLRSKGMKILERNGRFAGVEVDIVAVDGADLVFVEVKSSERDTVHPEEYVGSAQRARYVRAAKSYISLHGLYDVNVRFDVVAVAGDRVEHITSAFDLSSGR